MRRTAIALAALGLAGAPLVGQAAAQPLEPYPENVDPYGPEPIYDGVDPGYGHDDPGYGHDDPGYGYDYDDPLYDAGYGAPEVEVSIDLFRQTLAPHGRWVSTPEYGLVWIPSRSVVGADFVPYATGGTWQYSDAGWTFVSNWDWGWAPFHYGRWYLDARLGWVWVPDTVWAPAWVDWRYGDGYVGWAPLPPRRHVRLLSDHRVWFFCTPRDMFRPDVYRYRVRSSPRIFHRTVLSRRPVHRGRARWYAGPRVEVIERVARTRAPRVRVSRRGGVVTRDHRRVRERHQRVAPRARIDRAERARVRPRIDRSDRAVRPRVDRAQRPRIDRSDRAARPRIDRSDRTVRPRGDRAPRPRIDRSDRAARPAIERRQPTPRMQRIDRPAQRARIDRTDRRPRVQRPDRARPRARVERQRQARPERSRAQRPRVERRGGNHPSRRRDRR